MTGDARLIREIKATYLTVNRFRVAAKLNPIKDHLIRLNETKATTTNQALIVLRIALDHILA